MIFLNCIFSKKTLSIQKNIFNFSNFQFFKFSYSFFPITTVPTIALKNKTLLISKGIT